MTQGTQHSADDPRNADILIWVNGALKPREQAVVSVFDSGFVLGDGVWEGFRVVGGQPLFLDAHLDRLYEGAKALMLDIGLDRAQLTRAILDTLDANDMHGDGVHVRLMVTRGVKRTPYQDYLEAAANWGRALCARLWRFQWARLHCVCLDRAHDFRLLRRASAQISDRPPEAETSTDRSDGGIAEGTAGIPRALQKDDLPLLRFNRLDEIRPILSLGSHGK